MKSVQDSFTFATTPTIQFGAGCLSHIGTLAAGTMGRSCLIVTDRGLVATGIVDQALTALRSHGIHCDIFDSNSHRKVSGEDHGFGARTDEGVDQSIADPAHFPQSGH